jgi:hypothetical protein
MNVPNLDRIVETYVPVTPGSEVLVLRSIVLPSIRELQELGQLRWFAFLLHPLSQVAGHGAQEEDLVIHLRLEPSDGADLESFVEHLPQTFLEPRHIAPLGNMAGVQQEQLRNADWAQAWRMLGESSEWVLSLVETHNDALQLPQAVQFIHFITNPLTLGMRCLWIRAGQMF